MKTSTSSLLYAIAASKFAAAHLTFQSFTLDGKDQGQHFAVQTPSNGNNPILDVTSTAMICNGGTATSDQVSVAAGSKITMQFHHNDPATVSGDADEPIAASHKGPIMVYIAAATSSNGEGAVWQKIYEDGFANGKWAVDTFITNKGAVEITLPNLTAGDYLIRPEIIALHEASAVGKAQFYNGCGQIKVTGSGSVSLPSDGTDMTKAYSATDPGVQFNIYGSFTTYPIPGPAVFSGAGGSGSGSAASSTGAATAAPTTSGAANTTAAPTSAVATSAAATSAAAQPTTLVTSTKPAATGVSAAVALYAQCGGKNYSGATTCASGTCKAQNDYYSQCLN